MPIGNESMPRPPERVHAKILISHGREPDGKWTKLRASLRPDDDLTCQTDEIFLLLLISIDSALCFAMRLFTLISSIFLFTVSPAQADIYKCTDRDGRVTYSNQSLKNCHRLGNWGGTGEMTDGPASQGSASSARPKPKSGASSNPSPADFPKVTHDTQKTRDNDRKRILEEELASENRALDSARSELTRERQAKAPSERLRPLEERVAQHERNVAQLNRELSKIR